MTEGDVADNAGRTKIAEEVAVASLVWLIVWLIKGTPNLEWFGTWNDWAVALLACIVFDIFSGREAGSRRRRT